MVGYSGSPAYTAYVGVTLTRSKVKVTELLNFRQLAKPCMLAAMTAAPLRGFLVFSIPSRIHNFPSVSGVNIAGTLVPISDKIVTLGVTLDRQTVTWHSVITPPMFAELLIFTYALFATSDLHLLKIWLSQWLSQWFTHIWITQTLLFVVTQTLKDCSLYRILLLELS